MHTNTEGSLAGRRTYGLTLRGAGIGGTTDAPGGLLVVIEAGMLVAIEANVRG